MQLPDPDPAAINTTKNKNRKKEKNSCQLFVQSRNAWIRNTEPHKDKTSVADPDP